MKIDRKQLDLRRRVVVDHKLKRGPVYTVIHSALRMPTTEEGGCIYKQFKVSLTTNIDATKKYIYQNTLQGWALQQSTN